jgi:hypothetical membrane protein
MKLSREIVRMIGLFLICVLQIHCTLGRGLSTPEERAKAIDIARSLERDPLAKDAAANRQWLLNWIIEVPDIRFKSCVGLLSSGVTNQYRYSAEVNQQIIFSAAAFKLEHPDNLRNDTGGYIAGVEGALRVSEMLMKSVPDAKLAFLDNLVAKRDRGELADHLAKLAKEKCRRPKTELILYLAGTGVGLMLALIVARWFGGPRARRLPALGGTVGGKHMAKSAAIVQWIVFGCAAYYLIVVIALHILEPEFDPRFRFMSEYALGDYGWLMTTTFFALGLAAFAVGLRYVHQSSRSARIGFGLLVVAALFVWLAGVFRDSIPFSWRGSFSQHAHGRVDFVMDFSASCRMAKNLRSKALHCSCNACHVFFNGRRCRDARIAAASFHFSIPVVAFDRRSQVGSINCLTNSFAPDGLHTQIRSSSLSTL